MIFRNCITFFKQYIRILVPFTMSCAVACLMGQFIYPDSPNFKEMFICCMAILGGELLTYALKSFVSKKEEEKNKLIRYLKGEQEDGMDGLDT